MRHTDETVRAYDLDAVAYAANGGRDARLMEELGLRVRRTDITPAFVALLREQGHAADVLDPLCDNLGSPDGAYDVEISRQAGTKNNEPWLEVSAART